MNAVARFKHILPLSVRHWLRPAYVKMREARYRHFCPVCERKVPRFGPLPSFYWEKLKVHGSDLRMEDCETCNWNAYFCPSCECSDRERLYALYLAKRLSPNTDASFQLLDIAPSYSLAAHIRRKYPITYRTADLFMDRVDDRVDIMRMDCYPDAQFDAFICSHVLEHVADDRKAMSELHRILKPGGWGIAMVPINLTLTEIREDPSAPTEGERWRRFGQGDHVRFYTHAGFVSRLREVGFRVVELGSDFFSPTTFQRCGLAGCSILYVVEKGAIKVL